MFVKRYPYYVVQRASLIVAVRKQTRPCTTHCTHPRLSLYCGARPNMPALHAAAEGFLVVAVLHYTTLHCTQ